MVLGVIRTREVRREPVDLLDRAEQEVEEVERVRPEVDESTSLDNPWIVLVWNDPINLMSYVTHVFSSYFGYERSKAEHLMMQVHMEGRAVVSSGCREAMRLACVRRYWAVMVSPVSR